ncbi:MAG: alginate export family protein, partial [Proteobacteria bacterium]|nr:alginate export family protein [Pseudomonadota bacterium]
MIRLTYIILLAIVAISITLFLPANPVRAADQEQSELRSLRDGKLKLNFRYRYELVDQDGIAKDAHASTLRTRLTYQSPYLSNFGFLLEFDDVRSVGNDLYNSTRNGNIDRPVVADPEGTEVNQALVSYKGFENTLIRAGRRRIKLDNDRFIGNVGWRQNEQTFDSISLTNTALPKTTVQYAYIGNVNRIFGPDDGTPPANFDSNSHILNVQYAMWPNLDITAYAYLLDLENAPSASNRTLGIRVVGSNVVNDRISVGYTIEYADQADYGDNPNDYSADYVLLEGALTMGGITAKLGYEVLGGGAVQAFQTPLATLHAFQGWA